MASYGSLFIQRNQKKENGLLMVPSTGKKKTISKALTIRRNLKKSFSGLPGPWYRYQSKRKISHIAIAQPYYHQQSYTSITTATHSKRYTFKKALDS
jgi:hypothetical protein